MARKPESVLISYATEYEDHTADEALVIPEDLTTLSDEEIEALHTNAVEAFTSIYGDGTGLTAETLEALSALTEGVEAIAAEIGTREAAAQERAELAAQLAARVAPAEEADSAPAADSADEAEETDEEAPAEEATEDEAPAEEAEAVVASARKTIRVPMAGLRSNAQTPPQAPSGAPQGIRDLMTVSGEGLGFAVGTGIDFNEAGEALSARLARFNTNQFTSAARAGRSIREQHNLLSIRRPIPEDMVIKDSNAEHINEVLNRAGNEGRLPAGNLVASGGWCAPSEVIYDFMGEDESRDGLLSIPEIGVNRGGLSFTQGPDFADIFKDITGFSFTEEQDVAGEYAPGATPATDPNVVGDKPCYKVECPEFEEYRLDVDGLCISSGMLASKGYPEVLARTVRGALVAHDHRINGKVIAQIAAGSTGVTMPTTQAGATAPVLTAIELQVEHYRYSRRLSRGTTLEAIFPYWVRGAIRSDLSRRLGVDLLSVPDARIDGWFRERGVNPQFVYNWQSIDTTAAGSFTAWPSSVKFLLYSAGTWVKGISDIITLDTIYDSVNLAQNDFTALFTEEGWFVAKRGHDSRLVTVGLEADGATHAGIDIAHNGTIVVAGGGA